MSYPEQDAWGYCAHGGHVCPNGGDGPDQFCTPCREGRCQAARWSRISAQGILDSLGAKVSPDLGAYAEGLLGAGEVRCVLCGHAPCDCPPFGTPAYFSLVDWLHRRRICP